MNEVKIITDGLAVIQPVNGKTEITLVEMTMQELIENLTAEQLEQLKEQLS